MVRVDLTQKTSNWSRTGSLLVDVLNSFIHTKTHEHIWARGPLCSCLFQIEVAMPHRQFKYRGLPHRGINTESMPWVFPSDSPIPASKQATKTSLLSLPLPSSSPVCFQAPSRAQNTANPKTPCRIASPFLCPCPTPPLPHTFTRSAHRPCHPHQTNADDRSTCDPARRSCSSTAQECATSGRQSRSTSPTA